MTTGVGRGGEKSLSEISQTAFVKARIPMREKTPFVFMFVAGSLACALLAAAAYGTAHTDKLMEVFGR